MSNQEERDRLLQKEWREEIIPSLGGNQWIRVYKLGRTGLPEQVGFFCGLIPNANVQASLRTYEWDIYVGEGVPAFVATYDDTGNRQALYDRYGHLKLDIEPLVLVRSFHDFRPDVIEIAEEFRFFHNLFLDDDNTSLVRHDESGDIVPVVRMSDNFVDIHRKHIRQFLAAKEMSLVLYFERMYFSCLSLEQLNVEEDYQEFASDSFAFSFSVRPCPTMFVRGLESQSWILGKAMINGLPVEKCGVWPFDKDEQKQYEKFVIDVNEDDEPISYTSNPDALADYFGNNRHAPNYLTSVFFTRTVLSRYFNEPEKFRVVDGQLMCGSKWSLLLDNSHPQYVVVFLGDLGRNLPHKEQLHWKRYNVVPDGMMSETYFRRSFLNQWPEPEDNALRFQKVYGQLSKIWLERFGWHLFKPLSESDSHHLSNLRRPLTRESTEFHNIILSLSILLQDRINKKELGKHIPGFQPKNPDKTPKGNIPVLGEFLESEGVGDTAHYVEYLRMLQLLRSNSGTVHPRNEKENQKAVAFFSLDSKSTVQVADDIFNTLTEFLDSLREHFCPDESD